MNAPIFEATLFRKESGLYFCVINGKLWDRKKNSLRTTWTPKKEATAHSKRRQLLTSWHGVVSEDLSLHQHHCTPDLYVRDPPRPVWEHAWCTAQGLTQEELSSYLESNPVRMDRSHSTDRCSESHTNIRDTQIAVCVLSFVIPTIPGQCPLS